MYKGLIQTKKWQGWSSYELSGVNIGEWKVEFFFCVEFFGLISISLIGVRFRLGKIYGSNLGLNNIIENEKKNINKV